jgi:hypothetical protein
MEFEIVTGSGIARGYELPVSPWCVGCPSVSQEHASAAMTVEHDRLALSRFPS